MVSRRDRDPRIAGEETDPGGVLEPAQHEDRLLMNGPGPLVQALVMGAAVCSEPAAHGGQGRDGYVERGTIGDHVGSCRGEGIWRRLTLTARTPCATTDTPLPPRSPTSGRQREIDW